MTTKNIIERLNLAKHPEGGYFRETYRSDLIVKPQKKTYTRAAATHIFYFLPKGEYSKFHKVKHDEIWNLYDGGGVKFHIFDAEADKFCEHTLSARNFNYHAVIKGGLWQAAEPIGDYALVGCTVTPGYEVADEVYLCDDPETTNQLLRLSQDGKRLI